MIERPVENVADFRVERREPFGIDMAGGDELGAGGFQVQRAQRFDFGAIVVDVRLLCGGGDAGIVAILPDWGFDRELDHLALRGDRRGACVADRFHV